MYTCKYWCGRIYLSDCQSFDPASSTYVLHNIAIRWTRSLRQRESRCNCTYKKPNTGWWRNVVHYRPDAVGVWVRSLGGADPCSVQLSTWFDLIFFDRLWGRVGWAWVPVELETAMASVAYWRSPWQPFYFIDLIIFRLRNWNYIQDDNRR